jgi:hypothetical protein
MNCVSIAALGHLKRILNGHNLYVLTHTHTYTHTCTHTPTHLPLLRAFLRSGLGGLKEPRQTLQTPVKAHTFDYCDCHKM